MDQPYITVIMPVYNAEKYVHQAISSVLEQSFSNFELLIFNDCSTDQTKDIILSFQDERILLFDSPFNTGYVKHLNDGLSKARGKYIARMDADDICDLDRFNKQVSYLDQYPQVVCCGSFIEFIGGRQGVLTYPVTHRDIVTHLLIHGNAMAHPAVMMRRDALLSNGISYNAALEPAEDYDLWNRLTDLGELHNIPEVLLKYRVHDTNESVLKKNIQDEKVSQIRHKMIYQWDSHNTSLIYDFLMDLHDKYLIQESILHKIRLFVVKLISSGYFNEEQLKTVLGEKFSVWCRKSKLPWNKKVIHYLLFPHYKRSIRLVWSLLSHE